MRRRAARSSDEYAPISLFNAGLVRIIDALRL